MIYENEKKHGTKKHKSRSLKTNQFRKDIKEEDTPKHYSDKKNIVLEEKVPTWDISCNDLVTLYDEARFELYLDWELEEHSVTGQCSKTPMKRRIPWLYPEKGFHFYLQLFLSLASFCGGFIVNCNSNNIP